MASSPDQTPFALTGPLPVEGVKLGVAAAGIRYSQRDDLVVMSLDPGTRAAAVFTRNAFCAAPVRVARDHLNTVTPRALLINSGNANAGTGGRGLEDARATCAMVAERLGVVVEAVLPFSTGVIGEHLPVDRFGPGVDAALENAVQMGWHRAARAIMTTDTVPKIASRRIELHGNPVTITGMAKGSGMICPDMATMLAFVATDARLSQAALQHCLDDAVDMSFNAITVDGDTSTNDACVLLATGGSGGDQVTPASAEYPLLQAAVRAVCVELAQAVVADGEGATKFVTVLVEGGRDRDECRRVAYTIAHSPLVKTAFTASDPNWGRILAAVGRAGISDLDLAGVRLFLDEVCIVANQGRAPDYTEAQGQVVMSRPSITIRVELGRGDAYARIWTTDLSHEYVSINSDYRS